MAKRFTHTSDGQSEAEQQALSHVDSVFEIPTIGLDVSASDDTQLNIELDVACNAAYQPTYQKLAAKAGLTTNALDILA